MATVVVAVRSKRAVGIDLQQDLPYFCGQDPATGEIFAWTSAVRERVLDEKVLAQLQADPRLEVRVLDARDQAAARRKAADEANVAAAAAEAKARELRTRADALELEAMAAEEAAGKQPPPETKPAETPYTDQLLAALPGHVREKVQKQELDINVVREQMQKSTVRLASEAAAPKPGGALAEAKAQAAGIKTKK